METVAIGDGELEAYLPGPVLLLGAPGVGKGTQAQRIVRRFLIPQISTGDLLRDHVRRETALGTQAKQLMDAGNLVPDDVVNGMVAERLQHPDTLRGYILDGFPRTKSQSEWLDGELLQSRADLPLVALQIQVPQTELLQRITGRRICQTCQHIFNIYSNPPKQEGLCDEDGSSLEHRSDDTEAAFYTRMAEYDTKTSAVVRHYGAHGRFHEINGLGAIADVESRLIGSLRKLRMGRC